MILPWLMCLCLYLQPARPKLANKNYLRLIVETPFSLLYKHPTVQP